VAAGSPVAVLQPVLGSLTGELQTLAPISNDANSGGSSYGGGWYGYVERDLQGLLGGAGFSSHYCGNGDVNACSVSLWQSLERRRQRALRPRRGPDPRSVACPTRPASAIRFSGFIPNTMRWTNRPTFQQVVVFGSHR